MAGPCKGDICAEVGVGVKCIPLGLFIVIKGDCCEFGLSRLWSTILGEFRTFSFLPTRFKAAKVVNSFLVAAATLGRLRFGERFAAAFAELPGPVFPVAVEGGPAPGTHLGFSRRGGMGFSNCETYIECTTESKWK